VRSIEDDWLPDENDEIRHPDEIGDVNAAVALINEVLGEPSGEVVGDDVGDAIAATDQLDVDHDNVAANSQEPNDDAV